MSQEAIIHLLGHSLNWAVELNPIILLHHFNCVAIVFLNDVSKKNTDKVNHYQQI